MFRNPIKRLAAAWSSFLNEAVPFQEIRRDRIASALPSISFFSLLLCSTVIATLGLISNSSAVVIGAMIVAPLMNPILSAAFGISSGSRRLILRSLGTLLLGTALTVGASYVMTTILPVNIVGPEILSRTTPNLIDLAIALAAGFAGAFSITRNRIASSIAGVAIAVALVPPLCVTGIGLGLGQEVGVTIGAPAFEDVSSKVAGGSFLLFLANLVGINVAASTVFLAQGYGSIRRAWGHLITWLVFAYLLLAPLSHALNEFYLTKKVDVILDQLALKESGRWQNSRVRYLDVQVEDEKAVVDLIMEAPLGAINRDNMEQVRQQLLEALRSDGIRHLEARVRVLPIEIYILGPDKAN